MDDIKNELFAYVKENTFKETGSLQSDTMIFVEGILDSMGFALLLDFLESKFQITADDSDLIEENFESIDAACQWSSLLDVWVYFFLQLSPVSCQS